MVVLLTAGWFLFLLYTAAALTKVICLATDRTLREPIVKRYAFGAVSNAFTAAWILWVLMTVGR